MSADAPALRKRVAELEDKLDGLTRAQAEHEHTAVDQQGRKWTLDDFLGMGFTRRQALGAVAAIAGGASMATVLGGQVQAQTTGDEGVVGLETDRAEGWFSEIDATEIATEELHSDTDLLAIGPSGGLIHRRDPADSTTPVQDAIDAVDSAGGGEVILPPGTISEQSAVNPAQSVTIRGRGYKTSGIEIQDDGEHGIHATANVNGAMFRDFGLTHANGVTGNTGSAIFFDEQLSWCRWERMRISHWNGNVIDADMTSRSGQPFQHWFHNIDFRLVDAGNATALVYLNEAGPHWTFRDCVYAPDDANSGADSQLFRIRGTKSIGLDGLNIGGSPERIVDSRGVGAVTVDRYNYEPGTSNSTTPYLLRQDGANPSFYGQGVIGGAADYFQVYNMEGGGRAWMTKPEMTISPNQNVLHVDTDPIDTFYFLGSASEVNNTSGSAFTTPVHCLEDGVFKQSTGTGYDGGTEDTKYGP